MLRWQATEVAELLGTSVASVNSALQRARATLEATRRSARPTRRPRSSAEQRELLDRYVEAFEAYDIDALTELIREDATQSMPPFDLWLSGRDDIFTWWFGPGIGCQGSRVIPPASRTARPPTASTSRATREADSTRGRCRWSRSQRQASPSSPSFSTPRRSSRSSGCPLRLDS